MECSNFAYARGPSRGQVWMCLRSAIYVKSITMNTIRLIENSTFVHNEHQEWLNQLNFYQDEIKFFQNELALVLLKNLGDLSIIEYAEEYKSIFLKKLQHIDELRHEIISHEKTLSENLEEDTEHLKEHNLTRDKFLEFVSKFESLKKAFKRFAAHND